MQQSASSGSGGGCDGDRHVHQTSACNARRRNAVCCRYGFRNADRAASARPARPECCMGLRDGMASQPMGPLRAQPSRLRLQPAGDRLPLWLVSAGLGLVSSPDGLVSPLKREPRRTYLGRVVTRPRCLENLGARRNRRQAEQNQAKLRQQRDKGVQSSLAAFSWSGRSPSSSWRGQGRKFLSKALLPK